MYFYVIDAMRNKSAANLQQRLRDELLRLGIAGEMTTTNPLRSAHELAQLGLQKGYTTIVAVGDDRHVSEVATGLVGTGVALGVLPIQASPGLVHLLGIASWKDALQALAVRKLRQVTLTEIIRGPVFMTHASLSSRLPTLFQVVFDGFQATVQTKEVVVATVHPVTGESKLGKLHVLFRGEVHESGFFAKVFGAPPKEDWTSSFLTEAVRVQTRDPHPVMVGGEKIAQTPVIFRALSERLRVVVAKHGGDEPGALDPIATERTVMEQPSESEPTGGQKERYWYGTRPDNQSETRR